ncbi:transmembrane protein 14C-like isoform 1-T1 [Pholidichthys leucotaenia]
MTDLCLDHFTTDLHNVETEDSVDHFSQTDDNQFITPTITEDSREDHWSFTSACSGCFTPTRSDQDSYGSVTSLLAGLLFGLLAAVGTYLMSQNPKNVWLSLGTAGTLAVVMGLRFLSSWKFMPAGLMTLTSGLMLAKIFIGMQNTRMHRS